MSPGRVAGRAQGTSSPTAHPVRSYVESGPTAPLLVAALFVLAIGIVALLAAGLEPAVVTAVSSVLVATSSAGLTLHGYRRQSDHWRREAWPFLWCSVQQDHDELHLVVDNRSANLPALRVRAVVELGFDPDLDPADVLVPALPPAAASIERLGPIPAQQRMCATVPAAGVLRVAVHVFYETHLGDVASNYSFFALTRLPHSATHRRRRGGTQVAWRLTDAATRPPGRRRTPLREGGTVEDVLASLRAAASSPSAAHQLDEIRRQGTAVHEQLSWTACTG